MYWAHVPRSIVCLTFHLLILLAGHISVPLARETGDYRQREPTLPLEPALESHLAANQSGRHEAVSNFVTCDTTPKTNMRGLRMTPFLS